MTPQNIPVGAFLRARRELLQPEDVGIVRGPHRRVSGLRREEVARRAGISQEYYLRLEQGRDRQPSAQVITALGRALLLDDDSLHYLHRLAWPVPTIESERDEDGRVPDDLVRLLGQWSDTPAYITDRHLDVVAANPLAIEMAPGFIHVGANIILGMFTAVPTPPYLDDWERSARALVACLRYHGDLNSRRLQDVVGALSIRSEEFRKMWAEHEARPLTSGNGRMLIDPLGWVNFRRQTLELPGGRGHQLTVFFGDEGSPELSAIAYLRARINETPRSGATASPAQEERDEVSRNAFSATRDDSSAAVHTSRMSS